MFKPIREAPEHLVNGLALQFPEPRSQRGPQPEAWRQLLQDHANRIWIEAFHHGAQYGISLAQQTKYILISDADHSTFMEKYKDQLGYDPEADEEGDNQ